LNIFIYGSKNFKNNFKQFFLKQDLDDIDINIEYLQDIEILKEKLKNKTQYDIFLIEDNFIYKENFFIKKLKFLHKLYQNKIEQSLLKEPNYIEFSSYNKLLKYILQFAPKKNQQQTIENEEEIQDEQIQQIPKKSPSDITKIEDIEEEMLKDINIINKG
jgi:hypothetical protein